MWTVIWNLWRDGYFIIRCALMFQLEYCPLMCNASRIQQRRLDLPKTLSSKRFYAKHSFGVRMTVELPMLILFHLSLWLLSR
jgi:hypothetical protein